MSFRSISHVLIKDALDVRQKIKFFGEISPSAFGEMGEGNEVVITMISL
jgi:hypothetical protein